MARPAYHPTDKDRGKVEGYAACGMPQDAIADMLRIDPKTLREYFREELDLSAPKANVVVAQRLYGFITAKDGFDKVGNPKPAEMTRNRLVATMFWLKTRAGWRETDRRELVGKDGAPIQIEATAKPDLSALDQEGRDALRLVVSKLALEPEGDAEGA